jgi:predicted ribosome quality control (RQC) complex YloA/Tae2 family protein
MHNSYFFLKFTSAELNEQLTGWRLVSCFSQSKDELVIEFNNSQKSFFIKALLQSEFCCLSFPTVFNRARKNSVDLFPEIILKEVQSVTQFTNERSFAINLSDDLHLIFKMHGNRANVLIAEDERVTEIFRNHLQADFNLIPSELNRELDWSQRTDIQSESDFKKIFFTLSNQNWEYLNTKGFKKADLLGKWNLLLNLRKQLEKGDFFITRKDGEIRLSQYPDGETLKQTSSAIQALNEFFLLHVQSDSISNEKQKALAQIREREKQASSYISKNQPLLDSILKDDHYQLWGDLVIANLHQIKKGSETISLESFREPGKFLSIKLKKDITPQKNAEVFYRKARNQKIEIEKLSGAVNEKRALLEKLSALKAEVEKSESPKQIRELIGQIGLTKSQKQEAIRIPYRVVEFKGFTIWIGKSATDNDELTLKFTHKDDLWLHAKDVAGSHVVIKQQSGKVFPKDVIERAAELAAFYSKRKGETLSPVAYTQKKFVRKRKGDPPGAVVVEKEKVIMVEPKN